jgi:hypothetical protein
MFLLLASAALSVPALASRPAMDPQVRLHLGASAVSGPSSFGVMAGMDTRLTRVIFMDIGGFGTLQSLPSGIEVEAEEQADYFRLRHALYLAPGLRVPHRQPESFAWDLTFRLGPALVWTADLNPDSFAVSLNEEYRVEADPAATGGLELLLRRNKVGLRVSGRYFAALAFDFQTNEDTLILLPQLGLEAIYQF